MENFEEKIDDIIDSEPLQKYKLKFAGIGAENVCFEVPGSDRKIIKISVDSLRNNIVDFLKNFPESSGRANISYKNQKEKIIEDKEQEQEIADIFGDEHVLIKGAFHLKIPLTKEIAIKILEDDEAELADCLDENKTYEFEMLMQTQLIVSELKNPEKYKTKDFGVDLLTFDDFMNSKDIPEALKKVEELVEKRFTWMLENYSPDYIEKIKEITRKIIQYSKNTGLMLDIFGPNNITVFTDKDGKVNYHLIDVILPGRKERLNKNIKEDKYLGLLRHYYTFYYAIKYLAEKFELQEKLEPTDLVYFKGSGIPSGNFPPK